MLFIYGKIASVESTPGPGTTFDLFFPAIDEEIDKPATDDHTLPTGNEYILIVDDEASISTLTQKRLALLGQKPTAQRLLKCSVPLRTHTIC